MTELMIGLIISMVFSAFFSGMEIAFVSSNRLRAEMDREKNGLSQRALAVFYAHPSNFISTMLVGNNIALVVYGILFAQIFDATLFAPLSDGARVTCDTLLSTVVVLFTGEFLPKTIFKSNPNGMLTFFALPAFVCYVLLYPVSRFSTALSRGLLRLFGVRLPKETEGKEFTKVDLDYLVQSSIDNAKDDTEIEDEVELFHNALDFADTKVRDCMIPRTEIDAIDIEDCTVEQLKNKFIDSGHSKIVVYRDDIDHIIGYIHSSELFKHIADISKHVREMPYVPETMAARKLMHIFLQQKKSLGVVVDEFGGTSGIVSLEDIVEEITGDIEDEHDSQKYVAKQLADGDYILSARLEIEKVNELFDLDLPESDDYMTVGGLILHEYQSFPKLNEVIRIGRFEFKIVKNTMTKIELVRLKVIE
ncbi:MAG: HlyC/CorC family transporter [Prevotella sp.]|jgi:CBS domain containing-hemolysin-like protein|nr:HlyC/CorC family transporter [Prevotella sp.]MBQ5494741.1 HlyC/CorC family transporter [Prevotella sp.]MBQ5548806.1 HlyC/CorC family transporter [Prevotella sp.]